MSIRALLEVVCYDYDMSYEGWSIMMSDSLRCLLCLSL